MAEEILLDYAIDRPCVSSVQEETRLKVLLKINASNALRAAGSEVILPLHLVFVLDVSSSMKTAEIGALKEAARLGVDQLNVGDFVSVIAFQSVAYEIVEPTRIRDASTRANIKNRIEVIDQFQGGGTDLEYALTKAEHQLVSVPDYKQVRRIMVFTDGQVTGQPADCLRRAAEIADRGIAIDAMGFGQEFDFRFVQRLVSYSNGFTAKIDRPEDIKKVFQSRVRDMTNVIAKNVRLDLNFTPQVRAQHGYRYSPEISYLGRMRLPGDVRTISIPIGTIERDKEYSYLVTCAVQARAVGNIRLIKADLHYDIPTLGIEGGSSTQSIVVQYTDDPQLLTRLNGEVERAFDEAEVGRLLEELEASMRATKHTEVAMIFDLLAERYREFGDHDMASHYGDLKRKYAAQGQISQDEMNYTRHKSTQKRDSGVQLVDASSLI
ncbi:MAG: VWA domain-containing protein [Bradymonadaceae bacterium]|nr:VWA domain-containing protein [Lujinxingiaceae bacterium]